MQSTLSTILRSQPAFSSTSTSSTLPRSAARCRGVSCLWNKWHQRITLLYYDDDDDDYTLTVY